MIREKITDETPTGFILDLGDDGKYYMIWVACACNTWPVAVGSRWMECSECGIHPNAELYRQLQEADTDE